MYVVILAGGKGTRLSEYTHTIPKPMVKIGKKPIIEHIINHFKLYGIKKFLIAGGYKYKIIEKYFSKQKDIQVINTGVDSLTSKRIYKLKKFLKNEKNFFLTYGDGISNINIKKLYNFHKKNGSFLTISAVRPPARFGVLKLRKNLVSSFQEKPQLQEGWINGGFFVVKRDFLKFINNKNVMLEREPVVKAVNKKKVKAYRHNGFWKCVDNKRDLIQLNDLFKKGLLNFKYIKNE